MAGKWGHGQTPAVLWDDNQNYVLPALSYLDGGEHVNVQPWDHALLHQGKMFVAGTYLPTLENNGTLTISLDVTAELLNLHVFYTISVGGQGIVTFIREVTSATGGTAIIPRNKHGAFPDDSIVAAAQDAVIVGGTSMVPDYIAGGSGGQATGTSAANRDEWVVKAGTIGTFEFVNLSGLAKSVSFKLVYYKAEE